MLTLKVLLNEMHKRFIEMGRFYPPVKLNYLSHERNMTTV